MTKLKKGDIISVHGFVMLAGLDDGQKYRVDRIGTKDTAVGGKEYYSFTKPRGTKQVVAHYASGVDSWVGGSPRDNNRIEIVSKK